MLTNDDLLEIASALQQKGHRQLSADSDELSLRLKQEASLWLVQQQSCREAHVLNPPVSTVSSQSIADNNDDALEHLTAIRAPLPGIFYRASKPGAAVFVEVGDRVGVDTQICIIESMKLMNSVYAGVEGTVVDICLQDGHFAEKHGVLIRVEADSK